MNRNRYGFGFTEDDTRSFRLQAVVDFSNELIILYANNHVFGHEPLESLIPSLDAQEKLRQDIINETFTNEDLDDFVNLLYSRFNDLEVIRSDKNILYANQRYIFYKGKVYDSDYKDIDSIYLEMSKEKIISIEPEHKEYLDEVVSNYNEDDIWSTKALKLYYDYHDPMDWYNEEGVFSFEEWKEWFYEQEQEVHIYNLMMIIKELEKEVK